MTRTSISLLLLGLAAMGCARESRPPAPPAPLGPAPPGYAWPPLVLGQPGGSATRPPAPVAGTPPAAVDRAGAPAPVIPSSPTLSSTEIPEGDACLTKLDDLGIRYRKLDARRGVQTPIVVQGPLGGIEYVAGAGLPFEADCRLAVALHEVGPVLAELGISKLRYSGAYTYRMSRTGRLSLHAYGLAIDVHAALDAKQWHEVESGYQKGLGEPCRESAPLLNRTACRLQRTGLFKELITPDHNADHRDHLHLAIAPNAPAESSSRSATARR